MHTCLLLQVCRSAGYFEHALFVAQAAAETEWYLDILLEDLHAWDDALTYLQGLAREQAAAAHKKKGEVLCCAVYHAVPWDGDATSVVSTCGVLRSAGLCCTALYCTLQLCAMLCCVVL